MFEFFAKILNSISILMRNFRENERIIRRFTVLKNDITLILKGS